MNETLKELKNCIDNPPSQIMNADKPFYKLVNTQLLLAGLRDNALHHVEMTKGMGERCMSQQKVTTRYCVLNIPLFVKR